MFNDRDTSFYAGLILDGVMTYQNFSQSIPEFAQLQVYPDPTFEMFEGDKHLLSFKPNEYDKIQIWVLKITMYINVCCAFLILFCK